MPTPPPRSARLLASLRRTYRAQIAVTDTVSLASEHLRTYLDPPPRSTRTAHPCVLRPLMLRNELERRRKGLPPLVPDVDDLTDVRTTN